MATNKTIKSKPFNWNGVTYIGQKFEENDEDFFVTLESDLNTDTPEDLPDEVDSLIEW